MEETTEGVTQRKGRESKLPHEQHATKWHKMAEGTEEEKKYWMGEINRKQENHDYT